MQNEDVLRRMNRNRDKLDSVVNQYYFDKNKVVHKAEVSEHHEFTIEEWDQIKLPPLQSGTGKDVTP